MDRPVGFLILFLASSMLLCPCVDAASAHPGYEEFTDEFEVQWNLNGLADEMRVEDRPLIAVTFHITDSNKEKAAKVALEAINRELVYRDPALGVTIVPGGVRKEDGFWYVYYNWEYKDAIKAGAKPSKVFNIRIDLTNKVVAYETTKPVRIAGEAEYFEVQWNFCGLGNEMRVEERPDIVVDISQKWTEEEKVRKIGVETIRRELEYKDPEYRIDFALEDIKKKGELWYLYYRWDYKSNMSEGQPRRKFFNVRIDLIEKVIAYERSGEN